MPDLDAASLRQLVEADPESWSAVTLHVAGTYLTIVNSAHSPSRQRSNLAHELAHLLLEHTPGRIDISTDGYLLLSSFEREQEDEANWLAGALLVPRYGLVMAYARRKDATLLARQFQVSERLLLWRLRHTGVALQAKRANVYRRRRA